MTSCFRLNTLKDSRKLPLRYVDLLNLNNLKSMNRTRSTLFRGERGRGKGVGMAVMSVLQIVDCVDGLSINDHKHSGFLGMNEKCLV